MEDDDFRQWEDSQKHYELALCQRIARGETTETDAQYVLRALGLDTRSEHDSRS
jgi:hypothetical protein